MEEVQNAIAILGVIAIGGLWAFSLIGALAALWETFGGGIQSILERLRR
jgi:hypothetical protein